MLLVLSYSLLPSVLHLPERSDLNLPLDFSSEHINILLIKIIMEVYEVGSETPEFESRLANYINVIISILLIRVVPKKKTCVTHDYFLYPNF